MEMTSMKLFQPIKSKEPLDVQSLKNQSSLSSMNDKFMPIWIPKKYDDHPKTSLLKVLSSLGKFPVKNSVVKYEKIQDLERNPNSSATVAGTIEVSTIVNRMRIKNGKNQVPGLISNDKKVQPDRKRVKRSLERKDTMNPSHYVDMKKQASSMDRFYRHPKLTLEEQQKRLGKTNVENVTDDLKSRNIDTNPQIAIHNGTMNNTILSNRSKFQIVVEPMKQGYKYVPILPLCNSTTNTSGKQNANISLDSHFNYTMNEDDRNDDNVRRNDRKSLRISESIVDNGNRVNDRFESNTESRMLSSNQDYSVASTSVGERQGDKDYVASQHDGKKNVHQIIRLDIPSYDPDKIPYVEVPDYSDVLEESLDPEDRRLKKKDGKIDTVEPEVVVALHDNSELRNKKHEDVERNFTDSSKLTNVVSGSMENEKKGEMEKASIKSSNVKNANAPALSLLEEDKENEGFEEDFIQISKLAGINVSSPHLFKGLKEEEVERRGSIMNETSQDGDEKEFENGKSKEELEDEDESRKILKEVDDNSTGKFKPVIFDINEYRKPFNLDDLLKDNPVLKQLESLKNETQIKFQINGDGVSDYFDRLKGNEANKESSMKRENPGEQSQESFENFSKFSDSSDFTDKFEDFDGNKGNIKIEKMKDTQVDDRSDEYFFKSAFRRNKKNGQPLRFLSEKEFLSRYFSDDIVKRMQEEPSDNIEEEKENQEKKDKYQTLSTILKKKNHISRLNDDINDGVEDGNMPPFKYKNFWSLEYQFPYNKNKVVARRKHR